jgi:hypothetical protein
VADGLTAEAIAAAMARAERVACAPGDPRCSPFPDPVADARTTCTPQGRCLIGWIVANGGRDSWDVWLDVRTGEGRLRKQPGPRGTSESEAAIGGRAVLASLPSLTHDVLSLP